jgi:hypothetical protein
VVTFTQLMNLNTQRLVSSADEWLRIASELEQAWRNFDRTLLDPLNAQVQWSGDDARAAARRCNDIHRDMEAVLKEVRVVAQFLNDVTVGRGNQANAGDSSLEALQQGARNIQTEAVGKHLTIQEDGTVSWVVMRAPGPPPPVTPFEAEKEEQARELTNRLKAILRAAMDIDDELTRGLRVIFGTDDTFRTEPDDHGHRIVTGGATPGDRWNWGALYLAEKVIRHYNHWDVAADLFNHYLMGSGKTWNLDVNRMLRDIPAFRANVDDTLAADVRQRPDGHFETCWHQSAPNLKDGGQSVNWYYALNHFEYRLVGEKKPDGQITYHVEIRKRYDFGVPSEHRRDLPGHVNALHGDYDIWKQADIARLNMVGMAKDFDVQGTSQQMTA